jgi:UDP-N-acetylglucosamine 1-carboxyvinyltransferase
MLRIQGGVTLRGTDVRALDLRAGIALVLAGLTARGATLVHDAWQIERGYDHFPEKMRALGGQLQLV